MRLSEAEYQNLISRKRTPLDVAINRANAKCKPPLEDQEQAALVVWLKQRGIRHHHSPNGGYRKKTTAVKLKQQGVSAGFPDLIICPPIGSALPILFIELKKQRGGAVSESQQGWIDYLTGLSDTHLIKSTVCKGCSDAIKFIQEAGY